MSKLKDFKKNALKVGQATLATAMLVGGLMDYHPETIQEQPKPQVSQAVQELNEQKLHEFEMMWLDESNIIINGEILSNKDALAKYPNQAQSIQHFIEHSLREKERELEPNLIPDCPGKPLPKEMMDEIQVRLQNFDINDYVPTSER